MHKILVIRLYFPLDALHVSDCRASNGRRKFNHRNLCIILVCIHIERWCTVHTTSNKCYKFKKSCMYMLIILLSGLPLPTPCKVRVIMDWCMLKLNLPKSSWCRPRVQSRMNQLCSFRSGTCWTDRRNFPLGTSYKMHVVRKLPVHKERRTAVDVLC